MTFLLFFTWSQQVCHPCHWFSDAKLTVNLTYKHDPDQIFIKQPRHICQSGIKTSISEQKWHIIISAEEGYVFKFIKIHYGARSEKMF